MYRGLSKQEIGQKLFVSLRTVNWHNQDIFDKLDVRRRTEAIALAHELNFLCVRKGRRKNRT